MLSAFRAQPIYELKPSDKSKIESLLAYGDRLLVGLNTGTLRIYRVNEPVAEAAIEGAGDESEGPSQNKDGTTPPKKLRVVDLLREEEKFSRRAIQQLAMIKEANIIISLSDNYVSIHDRQTWTLQERLEKTRGASLFSVTSNVVKDPLTGIPGLVSRLAVVVKRRILWWSWYDMELAPEVDEISLPHTVKSLTWADGDKMMVGMDPGFSLINIDDKQITDIYKPSAVAETAGQAGVRFGTVSSSGMGYMGMGSWVPKPMSTNLIKGEVLLARDVNTLFVDSEGKALEKRQIPWAAAPEAIGFSYPYLLSLQPAAKGALDVRSPDTVSLLQTISLPNASILHVPQPNISLAHAGKGFLVASDRCIWRMAALSYEAQVDQLVEKQRLDEAISLLNLLEDTLLADKEDRLREVRFLKAQGLFAQQKYRPALDLFTDSGAPPARVVALYPRSIAGDLSAVPEPDSATDGEEVETGSSSNAEEAPKVEEPGKDQPAPYQKSVLERLKGPGKPSGKDDSDTASIRSVKTLGSSISRPADKPLEGADLKRAVTALCSFLAQSRVQIRKYLNTDGSMKIELDSQGDPSWKPPFRNLIQLAPGTVKVDWQDELLKVAQLVDTILFRAYMHANPPLAGSLFRLDNFCDAHVVEEKLYESGRYQDLIDFLFGKRLHREALELLAKFGRNEDAEEVMPALRGPARTVAYLQQLPPELIDIILEFSEWPIKVDPHLGLDIFLADSENAESLPRDKVLNFLAPLDKSLAIKYLEHVINELGDTTPEFHQRLVDIYLDQLKTHKFADEEEKAQSREKLEEFLRKSTQYNKLRTFNQLAADDADFFESRAIVLHAMGNHKQALQIYVFQLKDYAKAEAYCNKVYLTSQLTPASPTVHAPYEKTPAPFDPEDSAHPNIYTTLLSLYLKPSPPNTTQWGPAIDLLSNHGPRLPAASTLDLMPPDLQVSALERYFRGRIRNANSLRNEERIVRGLAGVRKVDVEKDLLLGGDTGAGLVGASAAKGGKSRRVIIREDDHCKVCHKRFGASAVRVYPDNEVIHYGCVGRSGVQRVRTPGDLEGMRKMPWGF